MASNLIGKIIIWAVALFYTYGALVHIMNILGLSGFDWAGAPLKWQLLDIVYLFLDVVVAVGFFAGWRQSYYAFYTAAASQVLLYTIFRSWILDVPEAYTVSPEQESYLTGLVVFHLATILLVSIALKAKQFQK